MKKIILNIFILLFTSNVALLGNSISQTVANESTVYSGSSMQTTKTVEVALDSFSNMGIFLMIMLSSLLGVFFIKDEFSSMLE